MRQSYARFSMYRYRLQPGDGTAYEFFIAPLSSWLPGFSVDLGDPPGEGGVAEVGKPELFGVVRGVSPHGDDYVTLGICSPGQGVYEVKVASLRSPGPAHIGYLKGHMSGVGEYILAAVVLAASVLVDSPGALEEACRRMLEAPGLLSGNRGKFFEEEVPW